MKESRHVEVAVGDAISYLEDHQGSDRPFYLNIATGETHPSQWGSIDPSGRASVFEPWHPDEAYVPPFLPDTPQTRQELKCFQGCIRYMDPHLGTLFEAVDRLGYRENTVVVFTNDHGVATHRAKSKIYEAGSGISLLVQAPGVSGVEVDHLVQNIDYTPTLLELAGVEIPGRVQGKSFAPVLAVGSYEPHDEVFLERNYHSGWPRGEPLSTYQPNPYYDPMRAVVTDRFRYLQSHAHRPLRYWLPHEVVWNYLWPPMSEPRDFEELFDLENDPTETVNLSGNPEFQSVKKTLSDRLDRWMEETEDPILRGEIPDRINPWQT